MKNGGSVIGSGKSGNIQIVELVRGDVVDETNDMTWAYDERDRLQNESLAAGFDLKQKRYGLRVKS